MSKKKVAIVSGVGIPANYSGYETLIENIAQDISKDFELYVYCSSKSYNKKMDTHKGAKLVYLPLKANGYQSILYDLWSILDAIFKRKIHTILILGVGVGMFIPILKLISRKTKFIVHLDGLEWKRSKWNKFIRSFLKFNEKIAGKHAHNLIADNLGIVDYITEKFNRESSFIQYGSTFIKSNNNIRIIEKYKLPLKYDLSICRVVPENNTELILSCFEKTGKNLVFIGNWFDSEFAKYLHNKYENSLNIHLIDKVYDEEILSVFKHNASRYIHGHSVGGTNPSLIEAMYYRTPIIAFDVNFNRYTTFEKCTYFKTKNDLLKCISSENSEKNIIEAKELSILANENYSWKKVSEKYKEVFIEY